MTRAGKSAVEQTYASPAIRPAHKPLDVTLKPMRLVGVVRVLTLTLLASLSARAAAAQTADNILLVVNDRSPVSTRIGEYYARARAVAADHVVHLQIAVSDEVSRRQYDLAIQQPIESAIVRHGWQDRILYIVLTNVAPIAPGENVRPTRRDFQPGSLEPHE